MKKRDNPEIKKKVSIGNHGGRVVAEIIQFKAIQKAIKKITDPIFNKVLIEKAKEENKSLNDYLQAEENNKEDS